LLPRPPRPTLSPYTTLFRSFFGKTLGLLLASLALASCGGGGGDGGGFTAPQSGTITLQATSTTIPLNSGGAPWFPSSPFSTEVRSEEHTSELQSRENLVCRL